MTDNASSYYSITCKLQSTLEVSEIKCPALRIHIPCMAHVIQLALGAFITSLGVNGHTKCWEANESYQQFGENETIDIGKSQRLWKEDNARINKVSAMRLGFAKIIEKPRISWYFESAETDFHIAENACSIDYTDTWSLQWLHSLTKTQFPHCGTSDYGCEDTLEHNTGVAQAHLPITGLYTQVAPKSHIQWSPATFHNSRWIEPFEVCHGSIEAISILDPVDVEETYIHITSGYHSVQWHIRSHGWCDVTFA